MTSAVGRRVFLGSATAAGVGATILTFNKPVRAHGPHTTQGDPQIESIAREVARIVKQMPAIHGPGPLLAMASTLRLFASAVEARRSDDALRIAVERLVRSEGHASVIARAKSPEMVAHRRQVLSDAGIPFHQNLIPDAVYEAQLQALLAGGALVTQTERSAAALESAYAALQARPARRSGLRLVRQDPEQEQEEDDGMPAENPVLTQIFRCAYLSEQCDYYSALAELACSAAASTPLIGLALAPICIGLGLTAGGYCYAEYHYEC